MTYPFQKIAFFYIVTFIFVSIGCHHIKIKPRISIQTAAPNPEKIIEIIKNFHNTQHPDDAFKTIIKVKYLFKKNKHTIEEWILKSQNDKNYIYRIAIKPEPDRSFDWYIREYPES